MSKYPYITDKEWEKIRDAICTVGFGNAKRVDGDDWKVYIAGPVIRIDVPMDKVLTK